MGTLDMRPQVTVNDTEDMEVKEDSQVETAEDREKELPDDSSTSDEIPGDESPAIEEGTSEKTVEEAPVADSSQDGPTEEEALLALHKEKEKILNDISQLRKERRQVRYGEKEEPLLVDKQQDGLLQDVAESDIQLIEKVLKAKGYVRKDEISSMSYSEKVTTKQDEWLKQHPEYLPENDKDDTKWLLLKGTIETYFKAPSNPNDIQRVMDLAHSMISPSKSLPVRSKASTDAAQEKIQTSSKGSIGGGTKAVPVKTSKGNLRTDQLQGFSEDEIKDLLS